VQPTAAFRLWHSRCHGSGEGLVQCQTTLCGEYSRQTDSGIVCQGRLRFYPLQNHSTIAVLRLLTVSAVAPRWMRGVSTVCINVH
jgi:hypothetical protein